MQVEIRASNNINTITVRGLIKRYNLRNGSLLITKTDDTKIRFKNINTFSCFEANTLYAELEVTVV